MTIELFFENLTEDVIDATVEVSLEDRSEADAPTRSLGTTTVGPLNVLQTYPHVNLDLDLAYPETSEEPALLVRVRGRTAGGQPAEFLNTVVTPVGDSPEPIKVTLTRIR